MAQAARWQPRQQQTPSRHAWRSGRRALILLAAAITIGWSAFATGTGPASASQAARSQLTASSRLAAADRPGAGCPGVGSAGFTPEPLAQAQHQATALAAKMTLSQELTLMHGVSPGSTPDGAVGGHPEPGHPRREPAGRAGRCR
ncbi:MAG TPA: hypothetical protein VGA04_19095 [Streptosporangiaceae bacterium]